MPRLTRTDDGQNSLAAANKAAAEGWLSIAVQSLPPILCTQGVRPTRSTKAAALASLVATEGRRRWKASLSSSLLRSRAIEQPIKREANTTPRALDHGHNSHNEQRHGSEAKAAAARRFLHGSPSQQRAGPHHPVRSASAHPPSQRRLPQSTRGIRGGGSRGRPRSHAHRPTKRPRL